MTLVCGQCIRSTNRSGFTWNEFVECDANDNVILSSRCDESCRTCAEPRVLVVPFDQCVSLTPVAQSFYNQGGLAVRVGCDHAVQPV